MRLDRLTAAIRPRSSWEGLDLGFALARRWFPALWGLWWLSALPLAAVSAIWLRERPILWLLLVWWLKPLYEAPLLYWLSRALFGEPLGSSALWRQRRLILPAPLLASLVWGRFHLSRSFRLPLVLLEGLSGSERRARQRVLQGNDATASWLTVICLHLESILWSSALLLLLFLVPEELRHSMHSAGLLQSESLSQWLSATLYILAMSVMAPFYVAAGFALYLTRRTELEAWDLELVFRRSANDVKPTRPGLTPLAAGLLAVLLLAPADPAPAAMPPPDQAREIIAEVLAGEDFGSTRQAQVWTYVGDRARPETETDLRAWLEVFMGSFEQVSSFPAAVIKWVVILLAVILVVVLLRRVLLDLRRRQAATAVPRGPVEDFRGPAARGLDRLPADVPAAAGDLLAAGDARGTLALLYRASLAHLVRRHGLAVPESATEAECLALIARHRPHDETALLARLTNGWQRIAYAHRAPPPDEMAALLQDWRTWWGRRDER
jgi:hypothetical protein